MNCYLNTTDDDINCTRIRTTDKTTLLINVAKKDPRRPDEYYTDDGNHEHPDPEILYSVTDVSNIEQGRGGFVNSVKAKHEDIAEEQAIMVRRGSARNQDLSEQLAQFMPAFLDAQGRRNSRPGSNKNSRPGSARNSRPGSISGPPTGHKPNLSRGNSGTATPTNERVLTRTDSSASSTCDEISSEAVEFIRAESEVIYSLTDVSDIEQGQGGFVKSLLDRQLFVENPSDSDTTGSSAKRRVRSRTEPFPV